ncbi:hypothetical protein T484DRAFT_3413565 [Baffinella frigidus]|nr:hypothetical protein T484DRAFT_3413565 [Cryptophyta sp. CCMP2293]
MSVRRPPPTSLSARWCRGWTGGLRRRVPRAPGSARRGMRNTRIFLRPILEGAAVQGVWFRV